MMSDTETDSGRLSGSRASTEPQGRLGPTGFDPGREDGWIEWSGGPMPVDPNTFVDVLWNNRAVTKNTPASNYGPAPHCPDLWASRDQNCRIIAYRRSRPRSAYQSGIDTELLFRIEKADCGFFAVRDENPRFALFGETIVDAAAQAQSAIAMEARQGGDGETRLSHTGVDRG